MANLRGAPAGYLYSPSPLRTSTEAGNVLTHAPRSVPIDKARATKTMLLRTKLVMSDSFLLCSALASDVTMTSAQQASRSPSMFRADGRRRHRPHPEAPHVGERNRRVSAIVVVGETNNSP